MQHNLIRILRRIAGIPLAPVITHGVGEDGSVSVERTCGNGSADRWVALETVFGDSIPEVKGAIRASSAEGTVLRVERDSIYSEDIGHVVLRRVSMAFE